MKNLKNCVCGKPPELKTSQIGVYTCSMYEGCGISSDCYQANLDYAVSDWNELMDAHQRKEDIKTVVSPFKWEDSPRGEAARRILGLEESEIGE